MDLKNVSNIMTQGVTLIALILIIYINILYFKKKGKTRYGDRIENASEGDFKQMLV